MVSIPPLGTLEVTTASSGAVLDPDGYQLAVNGPSLDVGRAIGVNGRAIFSIVTAGNYRAELSDVAGNCSVDANPQVADVAIGSTSTITFNVTCA